ncbi:MAG TPA: Ig-like domain-containing protein, partial [Archangium sp.]|uniref:Ig-like domain-containing protein n=1 Tax=Archangium sp. TaxID=1872627 RepID=UPI002ED7CBD5
MSSPLAGLRHPSVHSHATRLVLALLTLTIAACGGSEGSESAPGLTTTFPSDGASAVALNTRVLATFDMAMDPLTA